MFGDPAVTGKSADDDLREGKQTLLIALAEQAADDAGRRLLDDVLGNPDRRPRAVRRAARGCIETTGALARVEERIAERTALARAAIAAAPIADDARAALDALAVAATTPHRLTVRTVPGRTDRVVVVGAGPGRAGRPRCGCAAPAAR